MMEQSERASELATRLRRLLGPTEPGPQTSGRAHWDTMPRWNEPTKEFTRADEPATHAKILSIAEQPAVQFNMNVGSSAGGKIKGIDGLLIEIDPQGATETLDRLTRSGETPTLRTIASEMLEGRRETKEQLLDGPAWAGSKRGWIEPGEAATAVTKAGHGRASDVWTHVERANVDERAKGENYDGYLNGLAEDQISPEEDDDERSRADAVEGAEIALHNAFRPSVIHPTAKIDPEAVIAGGVRIGAEAQVEKRAHIGEFATVGDKSQVKRDAWVAPKATIGSGTRIAEWARVGSVGSDCRIGQKAYCRGTIGERTAIGAQAIVSKVGDDCTIGARTGVSAHVGNDVSIGKESGVGSGQRRHADGDRPTLQIPDNSSIGEHVHAPHGWQQTSGEVYIASGTSIGKDMAIPSTTRVEGTLDTPSDLAKALDDQDAPTERGKNCQIDETATIGSGCRIGDNVKIGANAKIGAGSEIGDEVHLGRDTEVGIAASVGSRNTITDGNSVGDGARTGRECLVGPRADVGANVTTGDYNQLHGRLMDGSRTGSGVTIGTGAVVGPDAEIGDRTKVSKDATIGTGCRVGGGVQIAERAEIGAYCNLEHRVQIGPDVKVDDHQRIRINEVVRHGRPDLTGPAPNHPTAAPRLAAGHAAALEATSQQQDR